jgi:hypothetical protein
VRWKDMAIKRIWKEEAEIISEILAREPGESKKNYEKY